MAIRKKLRRTRRPRTEVGETLIATLGVIQERLRVIECDLESMQRYIGLIGARTRHTLIDPPLLLETPSMAEKRLGISNENAPSRT